MHFSDGASTGGLVFGIPLTQCVENDRLSRAAAGTSPFRSRGELSGSNEEPVRIGRHGSRASFSSLFDAPRGEEVHVHYFQMKLYFLSNFYKEENYKVSLQFTNHLTRIFKEE